MPPHFWYGLLFGIVLTLLFMMLTGRL